MEDKVTFSNRAVLKAGVTGAKETTVTTPAVLFNPLINKTCKQERGNRLQYEVEMNPYGVRLLPTEGGRLYVKDVMPSGLVPDLNSIRLSKATIVSASTDAGYEMRFEPDSIVDVRNQISYQVQTEKDGSTVNIIRIPVDDNTPYILSYDAYAVQTNVKLTNSLSIEGADLPEGSTLDETESSFELGDFGDGGIGLPRDNRSVQITKVDVEKQPITFTAEEVAGGKEPAVFGLYTDKDESAKLLEATCDISTGICTFSQPGNVLDNVQALYLKELRAPTGYVADDTYRAFTKEDLNQLKSEGLIEWDITNTKEAAIRAEISYDGEAPAQPVEFTLYEDEACKKAIGTGNSSEDGKVLTFNGLYSDRTYYLKQTGTPAGYFPDSTVYSIKTSESSTPSVIQIVVDMTTAAYKVEHYRQKDDGSYGLADTEFPLAGKIGQTVSAKAKVYEGYSVNSSKSKMEGIVLKPAEENGELKVLVLSVYYDKKQEEPGDSDKPDNKPDEPDNTLNEPDNTLNEPDNMPNEPDSTSNEPGKRKQTSASASSTVPRTGDETNPALWLTLAGISLTIIFYGSKKKNRKNRA